MRIIRLAGAILIGLGLLLGAARAQETPDYVRLHVVARSDSAEDQALKLLVRDGVRAMSAALLADCRSADEAWETLGAHLPLLEGAARLFARLGGFEGEVQLTAGEYDFPERTYGEEVVPAGVYRALRVVLGEGEGQNWWCVLYPSLCLSGLEEETGFYSLLGQWMGRLMKEVSGWLAGS